VSAVKFSKIRQLLFEISYLQEISHTDRQTRPSTSSAADARLAADRCQHYAALQDIEELSCWAQIIKARPPRRRPCRTKTNVCLVYAAVIAADHTDHWSILTPNSQL